MTKLDKLLLRINACDPALAWAKGHTLKWCWRYCKRSDWMLWLAGTLNVDLKLLVRAAAECTRPALKYVPEGEERPARALEVALAWCDDRATLEEVRAAANAAQNASYAGVSYAANAAGSAATNVAATVYATDAATNAAAAVYAAAVAAYAADAATTADRAKYLADSAKTVRSSIPYNVIAKAVKETKRRSQRRPRS